MENNKYEKYINTNKCKYINLHKYIIYIATTKMKLPSQKPTVKSLGLKLVGHSLSHPTTQQTSAEDQHDQANEKEFKEGSGWG